MTTGTRLSIARQIGRATTKTGRKNFKQPRKYTPEQIACLKEIAELERAVAVTRYDQVEEVRKARSLGLTWGDIGDPIHLTSSSAWSRWSRPFNIF